MLKYPNPDECFKLLDLLCKIINANKGPETNEREWYSHNLANKFCNHCFFTILLTYSKSQLDLPSGTIRLSGLPSIDVLARASIESFLTFHYIFYCPINEEERNYKYLAYRLAGHMERKNLPVISPKYQQKLEEDKKAINKLSRELNSNSIFIKLPLSKRNRVLQGEWRLSSWRGIILEAGLSKMLSHYYHHLCGFAHSGSLSVLQAAEAHQKGEQQKLIQPSIYAVNILMASFIKEYCALFPKCGFTLNSNDWKLIKFWILLGNDLNDFNIDETGGY